MMYIEYNFISTLKYTTHELENYFGYKSNIRDDDNMIYTYFWTMTINNRNYIIYDYNSINVSYYDKEWSIGGNNFEEKDLTLFFKIVQKREDKVKQTQLESFFESMSINNNKRKRNEDDDFENVIKKMKNIDINNKTKETSIICEIQENNNDLDECLDRILNGDYCDCGYTYCNCDAETVSVYTEYDY